MSDPTQAQPGDEVPEGTPPADGSDTHPGHVGPHDDPAPAEPEAPPVEDAPPAEGDDSGATPE